MPITVPLGLLLGFLCGGIVNLLADYLPAKRIHELATKNPFGSRDAIPPKLPLFPRRPDGSLLPLPLWSGIVAALLKSTSRLPRSHTRRILVEMLLAAAFALIGWRFAELRNLPFMWFYAAAFVLVAVIDIEHRFVFLEVVLPVALVALAECTFWPRVYQDDAIKGGVYAFGIMLGLYLLGLVFAWIVSLLTGRRVGRTVLGFGDIYIAAMGGLIVGFTGLGLSLLIMVITGALAALYVIAQKLLKYRRYRMFAAIPYGPYILLGIAAMLYYPDVISDLVRTLLGWQ